MDLVTTAQLLGNFGEFFGAIAVVITLVYLAGQLRQNTTALRSASYEHWNQVSSSFTEFSARFADSLPALERHSSLDQLSPQAQKLLLALAVRCLDQAQTAFLQHRAGTLDDDVFESRVASYMSFVARNPLLGQHWKSISRNYPITAFRDYMEQRLPELRPVAS